MKNPDRLKADPGTVAGLESLKLLPLLGRLPLDFYLQLKDEKNMKHMDTSIQTHVGNMENKHQRYGIAGGLAGGGLTGYSMTDGSETDPLLIGGGALAGGLLGRYAGTITGGYSGTKNYNNRIDELFKKK